MIGLYVIAIAGAAAMVFFLGKPASKATNQPEQPASRYLIVSNTGAIVYQTDDQHDAEKAARWFQGQLLENERRG